MYAKATRDCIVACGVGPDSNPGCRLVQLLSFERSLDTVVWQLLASVACPGNLILIYFIYFYSFYSIIFTCSMCTATSPRLPHCRTDAS